MVDSDSVVAIPGSRVAAFGSIVDVDTEACFLWKMLRKFDAMVWR